MTDLPITRLDQARAAALVPSLGRLLQDVVHGGASVGFLSPLGTAEAEDFWRSQLPDVAQDKLFMFAAGDGDEVLGFVQVALAQRPNARHRAEIQKLLVHRSARRQGLATRLMRTAEAAALAAGRRLLVLDTYDGSPAELLYRGLGYQSAGVIPYFAQVDDGSLQATRLFYRYFPEG